MELRNKGTRENENKEKREQRKPVILGLWNREHKTFGAKGRQGNLGEKENRETRGKTRDENYYI